MLTKNTITKPKDQQTSSKIHDSLKNSLKNIADSVASEAIYSTLPTGTLNAVTSTDYKELVSEISELLQVLPGEAD